MALTLEEVRKFAVECMGTLGGDRIGICIKDKDRIEFVVRGKENSSAFTHVLDLDKLTDLGTVLAELRGCVFRSSIKLLEPGRYRNLLIEICKAKEEDSLAPIWEKVEQEYKLLPHMEKAEKVFEMVAKDPESYLGVFTPETYVDLEDAPEVITAFHLVDHLHSLYSNLTRGAEIHDHYMYGQSVGVYDPIPSDQLLYHPVLYKIYYQEQGLPIPSSSMELDEPPKLSLDELQKVTQDFMASYTGKIPFGIALREYFPDEEEYDKVTPLIKCEQGPCYLFLRPEDITDAESVTRKLRSLVLGEFGLNTFSPEDQRNILNSIVKSRDHPSIRPIWEAVDKEYGGSLSQIFIAQEIFCRVAENTDQSTFLSECWASVRAAIRKGLQAIGLVDDQVTTDDLRDLVKDISKGIKKGERSIERTNRRHPLLPVHKTARKCG